MNNGQEFSQEVHKPILTLVYSSTAAECNHVWKFVSGPTQHYEQCELCNAKRHSK